MTSTLQYLSTMSNASGAPYSTGTPEFMAIEVLEGRSHAPRHDLESFFYVFIWMYTQYPVPGVGSPDPPLKKPPDSPARGEKGCTRTWPHGKGLYALKCILLHITYPAFTKAGAGHQLGTLQLSGGCCFSTYRQTRTWTRNRR